MSIGDLSTALQMLHSAPGNFCYFEGEPIVRSIACRNKIILFWIAKCKLSRQNGPYCMQEQNNAPGKMQLTFHNLHCALNGVLLIECKVIELQCVWRSHACISNNIKEEICLLCRSLSACAQQKKWQPIGAKIVQSRSRMESPYVIIYIRRYTEKTVS